MTVLLPIEVGGSEQITLIINDIVLKLGNGDPVTMELHTSD